MEMNMIPCIILVLIDCGEINADGSVNGASLQHVKIDMVSDTRYYVDSFHLV